MENIRNFSIIAHIDHGKSTLSDRLLEFTHTVENRKMREQVLDTMELERERGITIKMTPVTMNYKNYILNLIDTPGHIDFSYEVSRSLRAVEGAILLVDATQGVQAQTLTTLQMAKEAGLVIIPVINKIDSPLADVETTKKQILDIVEVAEEEIILVSGKTGAGVPELLETIVKKVPAPTEENFEKKSSRALIFDFAYSNHEGVILYLRVLNGSFQAGDELLFIKAKHKFQVKSLGIFQPDRQPKKILQAGEIGYIVTGIKQPGIAHVGDTVTTFTNPLSAYQGYAEPIPLVFASIYPESQNDFDDLRRALAKLQLSDSSLTYEEEASGALGRGFRCGFLGMLHLEIVTERLKREFAQDLVITQPSITYEVEMNDHDIKKVYTAIKFPNHGEYLKVYEPWIKAVIILPSKYVSNAMQLFQRHEGEVMDMLDWGQDNIQIKLDMPLRELMRNFFDELKSISSGYASISYELDVMKEAQVVRLDILVAEEVVGAFSKVVSRARAREEGLEIVDKLYELLPRELFKVKIQAEVEGKIIASKTISAAKKDVTGYLYGGDYTRKMKLLEKQKKGKKRMQEGARVHIGTETFIKLMKK